MTGQSWSTIMKREREKELLFRGSQIKEAIENWNNPKYTVPGVTRNAVHPLMDLKDLLQDPYTLTPLRYLPHHYATELDGKNPKCGSECPKLKIYQDPMTGKEWTYIRGAIDPTSGAITPNAAAGIIGVASKSDEEPLRTNFKDTALENMGTAALGTITDVTGTINLEKSTIGASPTTTGTAGKMTKYSEWKFIAESSVKNDHSKIYRAYHEGW
jgi:hypothetical protein